MITSRTRRGAASAVALTAAAALMLSGCARDGGSGGSGDGEGAASSPGITDTTVTIGITTPLSGGTAGPGNCTVDGLKAYMGQANANGGLAFGDGKTREVKIEALDDAYDPQKASSNYQSLKNKAFIMAAGLGTPTNRAWREAANTDEVPQAFIQTGDPIFSDQEQSPWSLGLVPIYQNEGEAFGEALVASGEDHKVAVLFQNDDYGEGYLEGLKSAIEGSDNIEIVKELTYEATDTSVDAQITELAETDADIFFNAMSITPLVISALERAQSIDWKPSWFLPSNTSSPGAILEPGGADAYPGIYSVAFAKAAASPAYADDEDVQGFLANIDEYTDQEGVPAFPHCSWSYILGATLEKIFAEMEEPTRAEFLEEMRDVEEFQAPLMLDGTHVDTTEDGQPAISTVVVQKYNGAGYDTVEAVG